jgi:hypothetical protein
MLTSNNNNNDNINIGNNIENTFINKIHKKVTFMINELCDTNINDIVGINKCSTKADSKPILNNNYKYQRKSQPGYKRDYNNYYKNY